MIEAAFFLSGDGFPNDSHTETALRARMAWSFARWTDQREILEATGQSGSPGEFYQRLALFEAFAQRCNAMSRSVLFGRSSGARLATVYASRHPIRAVVCLAYPFRPPGKDVDPERTAHLARLSVPTLIFQGTKDEYGGLNTTRDYPMSSTVTVTFVETDHHFRLSHDAWDAVARTIQDFFARSGIRGIPSSVAPAANPT
jgi:predicted alpha/beta-hydrolase family hydrolase